VTDLVAPGPGILIAATSKGILRSGDGGRGWTRPAPGPAGAVGALIQSPSDPRTVLAAAADGIFRSEDVGAHWSRVAEPLGVEAHALAFLPGDDRVLFATTSGGLYRSDDGGAGWQRVDGGLPHSDLAGIVADGASGTLYVSDFSWGGVFRSADDGATWQRMPTDGLASDRVWTLGVEPGSSGRLVVAAAAGGMHVLSPAPSSRGGSTRADAGAKAPQAGARSSE